MNLNPAWAEVPTSDKKQLHVLVPRQIADELFLEMLPAYRTTTVILSHLLHSFYKKFHAQVLPHHTLAQRQQIAANILISYEL